MNYEIFAMEQLDVIQDYFLARLESLKAQTANLALWSEQNDKTAGKREILDEQILHCNQQLSMIQRVFANF